MGEERIPPLTTQKSDKMAIREWFKPIRNRAVAAAARYAPQLGEATPDDKARQMMGGRSTWDEGGD